MEVQKPNNSFCSPVYSSPGVDLSNDKVEVYELREFVEKGPSGESDDFIVYKKPVLVDSYHHNKVITERCKGCDLKSIIARVNATGDTTLLNQREVVYGDGFAVPNNLSDALERGVETSEFIDSLSKEEIQKRLDLSKMSKSDFDNYIKGLVDEKLKSIKAEEGGSENV